MTAILKNAQMFRHGVFSRGDVSADMGPRVSRGGSDSPFSVDASSFVILPGFVDVHVHLREPGFSYKETIRTGSLAAAHGGYTAVCAMPNLNPVPDSLEHLQPELEAIRHDAVVRVLPYGAITRGEQGEALAELEAMAPYVVAFSDDGKGVQNRNMMRRAMQEAKRLGKLIVAHCEDNTLLHGGYIHDGAYARAHGHRGICSESEWRPIQRDLELVRETGCGYHVCHISTKESVALIRKAKGEGLNVTCETGPHYLLLDDAMLEEDGRFKMNPPLRDKADREALLEGLADGTIDMVATDHAPHTFEDKNTSMKSAPFGIVGLEPAACLTYTELVLGGYLTPMQMAEKMSYNPAKIIGIDKGDIEPGKVADIVIFDPDETYVIDKNTFFSKGRNTPFDGRKVTGKVRMTLVNGQVVYEDKEK